MSTKITTRNFTGCKDPRWAAKSSDGARPNAKAALFFDVLGGLKKHSAYFSHKAIQAAANEAELGLTDGSLKVYLNQAVKQGLVHDAGRGWYSRLSEPVKLDPKPVAKLIRVLEKAFPLLDFCVWSTAQLNPWMHHLLAQPVQFVHVDRDAIESVAETLREKGWEVAENPTPSTGGKAVRPGGKMVVIRPWHSKQPTPDKHQAAIEHILVDLLVETGNLGLMDIREAGETTSRIIEANLVQLSLLQHYADHKSIKIGPQETS